MSYTDEEFLDLIRRVNELEPYAFYIVDSFGMMKRKDLTRLFYLVEHNLNEKIKIGFIIHIIICSWPTRTLKVWWICILIEILSLIPLYMEWDEEQAI